MYTEEQLKELVENVFKQADLDQNGTLEYTEWKVASLHSADLMNEDRLRRAFEFFDRDSSGSIKAEEIAQILGANRKVDRDIWD